MTTENKKFPLQRTEAYHRKDQLVCPTNNTYSVDYKLILCLRKSTDPNPDYPTTQFEGRMEVDFTYYDPKQEDIFLNFNGIVKSLIINGKVSDIKYENYRIYLSHLHLIANAVNKVIILFSAKYDKSGEGLHHFIDPVDKKEYLYTQFEPYECHLVFPVFDQPSIKGALDMTLVGPDEWTMLGNERQICRWSLSANTLTKDQDLVKLNHIRSLPKEDYDFLFKSVLDKHYDITVFATTPRISSYLFALCAGSYHCFENPYDYVVPLRVFLRDSLKYCGEPKEFFRVTMAGMEWYKKFFGIAYPFTKYDQLFAPEYNFGAMENVGLVTYNEGYCWKSKPTEAWRARFCITTLHELAHMWFGNLVTMMWWDDLWLNESFATFISFLCQSKAVKEEYPTSWIRFNFMKNNAYSEDQKSITHPIYGDITDTAKSETHFDGIVYYKGSSFLKQMYYFIGEENFSNGLKEYFKTYKWGNTTFDNFVDKMVSQLKTDANNEFTFDLKSLCLRWISKAGLNSITCNWESDSNGNISKFNIIQAPCMEEHKNLQTYMFDILFIYDDCQSVQKVMIGEVEQSEIKKFVGIKAPKAVLLNYNDWGYIKWIPDKTSFEYLQKNLYDKLPSNDGLSRQLFFKSMFDMLRDIVIPCTEYIDIIGPFLEKEADTDIILNVLSQVSGAIAYYLPPNKYITYAEKMFNLICKLCVKFLDNNQMLMTLMPFVLAFAAKEEHVMLLKEWLIEGPFIMDNGKKVVLSADLLDQDKRFSICSKCHQLTSISLDEKAKMLANEVEKDKNSDRSVRQTCKCRAALPDKAIKAEVWDILINKTDSTSLYNLKAYMEGFAPLRHIDLVKEFCQDKFYEELAKVDNKDQFFVAAFVTQCGPLLYPTLENIAMLQKKANEVTKAILKRELLELADDLKRFNKAQALCK